MARQFVEALEGRRLLSGGLALGGAVHSGSTPAIVATPHRKVRAALGAPVVTGTYKTTVNYHGLSVDVTLTINYQKHGRIGGTLDTSSLPFVGPAHEDFSGTVNADRTFAVTATGTATGSASGTFASNLKSATVTYDFDVMGMHFAGTRTFNR